MNNPCELKLIQDIFSALEYRCTGVGYDRLGTIGGACRERISGGGHAGFNSNRRGTANMRENPRGQRK